MTRSLGHDKATVNTHHLPCDPTRRIGEPDDIASAILYLASARASWVTGQVMSVNGGFVMP